MSDHSQIIYCHDCGVGLDTATQTIIAREVERSYSSRSMPTVMQDVPVTIYLCEYCANGDEIQPDEEL